jgi:hypothetical protein
MIGQIMNSVQKLTRSQVEVKPYNICIGWVAMGYVFQNIHNATIINKSNVQNAFNKVGKEYDEETSKALVKVAEFIENSKDPAAGVLFDNFTEELNRPEPDKSKLKSFWSGIEKALPTITSIATTVAKISSLFI